MITKELLQEDISDIVRSIQRVEDRMEEDARILYKLQKQLIITLERLERYESRLRETVPIQ